MRDDAPEPSHRQVVPASWWLAAELVRRHPDMVAYEMHPGGGMYDVLALVLPPYEENPTRVMLNRAGSIQVHSGNQMHKVATWSDFLFSREPRRTVALIERAAGLSIVEKAPASGARAIAYRYIARLLSITETDRHVWDVRNEFNDSSGDLFDEVSPYRGYLSAFPLAEADSRAAPRIGIWSEPHAHFWALLRDETPIGLVSNHGLLYVGRDRFDLMEEYVSDGRKLLPCVVRTLGHLLP
ncbi:TY-Chap2 family putative peptide chaperone [Microcella pacifica]